MSEMTRDEVQSFGDEFVFFGWGPLPKAVGTPVRAWRSGEWMILKRIEDDQPLGTVRLSSRCWGQK